MVACVCNPGGLVRWEARTRASPGACGLPGAAVDTKETVSVKVGAEGQHSGLSSDLHVCLHSCARTHLHIHRLKKKES